MIYMETLQVYTATYMGVLLWVLEHLKSSEDTMSLRYLIMSVTCFHTGRSKSSYLLRFEKMNGAGKKLYRFLYSIHINGI